MTGTTLIWVCTSIFNLLSLGFLGLCMIRLFGYVRRYRLPENRHTLLFGFIRLEHVVVMYLLFMSLLTLGSVLFISSLSSV